MDQLPPLLGIDAENFEFLEIEEEQTETDFLGAALAYDVVNVITDFNRSFSDLRSKSQAFLENVTDVNLLNKVRIISGAPAHALTIASVLSCVKNIYAPESTSENPVFTDEARRVLGVYALGQGGLSGLMKKGAFLADQINDNFKAHITNAMNAMKISIYA